MGLAQQRNKETRHRGTQKSWDWETWLSCREATEPQKFIFEEGGRVAVYR